MLVRGTVDLWFEENGEIHLVDYKTDDVDDSTLAARADDYAPQLALYALAIERAFGRRPAHAWLHFLRPDRVVREFPLTMPPCAPRPIWSSHSARPSDRFASIFAKARIAGPARSIAASARRA